MAIRTTVGIDPDKKIILWGTTQPHSLRKGKKLIDETLNHLWSLMDEKEQKDTLLLQVGPAPNDSFQNTQPFSGIATGYLPTRRDMAAAYKMADVSVCTTVSDAGPMMVSESLFNECPVVGFDRSVILNMVENGVNGYIIENLDTLEMAKKTLEILRSPKLDEMSRSARIKAIEYHDLQKVQQKWNDLFKEIIGE
jgi:glycosyltransferase involved in cell wall biosynthesis